ncbi:hypothetical protein [Methylobacterium sp. J-090]|uniref:hypothetical protein n=1 Tax=Methylobacterium sp. J-090 TaxID=2836666 RepID=UPI001FBBBF78|nr:hypothetical protein [Methylobacterium sp. J-090]MCJ2081168.1 hypothetical protein [Methylobacterium sp. J-090]
MRTIRNAIENASREPITDGDILALLHGAGGHASHRRALFSDVALATLETFARAAEIPRQTMLHAYEAARAHVGAANADLDEAVFDAKRFGLWRPLSRADETSPAGPFILRDKTGFPKV